MTVTEAITQAIAATQATCPHATRTLHADLGEWQCQDCGGWDQP